MYSGAMLGIEPVVGLRVGHVAHALGENPRDVEFVADRRAVEVILLQPAELFAVRAIGQHRDHVRSLGPAHERADAVQKLVGAFEVADRLGRRMDDDAFDLVELRQRSPPVLRPASCRLAGSGSRRRRIAGTRSPGRRSPWCIATRPAPRLPPHVSRLIVPSRWSTSACVSRTVLPAGPLTRDPRHVRGVLAEVDNVAWCR